MHYFMLGVQKFEHLSAIMEKCIFQLLFVFSLSNLFIEANDTVTFTAKCPVSLQSWWPAPLAHVRRALTTRLQPGPWCVLMVFLWAAAHHFLRNE